MAVAEIGDAGIGAVLARGVLADSNPDRANGITQYIVGTGGRNLNGFGNFHTRPDIFVRGQSKAFGHLQLDLAPGGWDFRWISAPGQPSYVDEGSGTCH